ncbi:M48 family metallopeptidase [Pararcticibacter amylolyticus]|uniref:Peptidase M48 n=1 Tax=Pararcticibacter amylolyticus TaxID=2173175 RepID=A0A2U2PJR2_9SPHI|nr:M48 family metallopeptidase [Pararcticibacter amylolyticus]PWG81647.1 peptidase M48 [Pararcticibacter amylolyticus]
MKRIKTFSTVIAIAFTAACSTVPLTGRRQFNVANSQEIQQQAVASYKEFLKDPKTKVVSSGTDAQRVKAVGTRIASAIEKYLRENGYANQYSFSWEFNLVQSTDINAWCMPGGKVAVYTGIMPVAKTDDGLATVMGHEIAHAIARHTEERYSQTMGAQALGGVVGAAAGSEAINQLYGLGGQLALLKYGRSQESEADRLGLIFMAMAGYNPNAAVSFWQRMASSKQGNGAPPEFLSTHPSDATRIADIQKRLPEALKYYKK